MDAPCRSYWITIAPISGNAPVRSQIITAADHESAERYALKEADKLSRELVAYLWERFKRAQNKDIENEYEVFINRVQYGDFDQGGDA